MDAKIEKLALRLKDAALAEALVAAGLDNPAKIRQATDAQLDHLIGKTARKKLRAK
jgi:hypothetical protein